MRRRAYRIFVVLISVLTGSWGIWFATTRHSLSPVNAQGNPVPILWLDGDALWGWSGLLKRPKCFADELEGLWWSATTGGKVAVGWRSQNALDEWAIKRIAEHYRKHPPVNEDLAARLWQALKEEAQENRADRFAFEACRQSALKYLARKDFQDRFFLPAFARLSHHDLSCFGRSVSGDFWVFGFAWGLEQMAVPRGGDLGHVHWVVVNVKPPHKIVSSIACG